MRILYLADIRFPMERANGIQTAETAHALARRGVEVELMVRRTDERTDAECLAFFGLTPHPGLRLARVPLPRRGARPVFMLKALSRMRRGGQELVYTRDLGLAYAALRARRLHRRPVVYEAIALASAFRREAADLYEDRQPPSPLRTAWQRHVESTVARRADALIATTSHLLAAIERECGVPRRAEVIPNGARVPPERPPRRAPGSTPRVCYVGQLYPWKGVELLLDAAAHLPEVEVVVVGGLSGEPDLERLKRRAAALGVEGRVQFRGYRPPPEIPEERARADVLVIPHAESRTAREFTSPLKLFEALAAGRPIVATDLPAIRDVLRHGENALLVPPGDPRALAGAVREVLSNPELAERLAAVAFREAGGYSWETRAERIERLLREVLAPLEGSQSSRGVGKHPLKISHS